MPRLRHWLVAGVALVGLAAKPPPKGPLSKIDRMWAVGSPALDGERSPGLYVWVEDRNLAFAALPVGDGRSRIFQWVVKGEGPLELLPEGDCKLAARQGDRVVIAARPLTVPARCQLKVEGEATLYAAKLGRRAADIYVGPLAQPARKQLSIGKY